MGDRERVRESDPSVRKSWTPASVGGVAAAYVIGRAGAAGTLLGAAFALVACMAPPEPVRPSDRGPHAPHVGLTA